MPDKQNPGPLDSIKDQQSVADGSLASLENTNQETNPASEGGAAAKNLDAVITSQAPKNGKAIKTIVMVAGILVLVGGVGTGIFLLSQQQEIRLRAWDCGNYVFEVKRDGTVEARNGSRRDEPKQKAEIRINNELVATCDVPAMESGEGGKICEIEVPESGNFCWEVKGTVDCENEACYQSTPSPSPTVTPTPEITPTPPAKTPTPTLTVTPTVTPTSSPTPSPTLPPEIVAQCIAIHIYDEEWNLIPTEELIDLTAGDNIKISVSCLTTSGSFDRARFTINGQVMPETTDKKPGTNEFYIDYQIPEGVTNFNIEAEVHHTELGWF